MEDKEDWAGSEKVLRDGIAELEPRQFSELHNHLAKAIAEQDGRIDEAVEQMKCGLRISNEKNEVTSTHYLNMGALLELQGNFEQAIEHYWKVRELDPDNRISLGLMAQLHMQMSNYKEAEEAYPIFLKEGHSFDKFKHEMECHSAVEAYTNLGKIRTDSLWQKFENASLSGIPIPARSIEAEVQEIRAFYQNALKIDPMDEIIQRLASFNRYIAWAENTGLIC